jgi:hypothetical protein
MGVFASNWSAQTATAFSARACRGMVVGDADERAKRVVVARRVRRWEACILDVVFVLFSWVGEISLGFVDDDDDGGGNGLVV